MGIKESAIAIADMTPRAVQQAGFMKVELAEYPALQADFGSVRIGTSAVGRDHYPLGLFPPILINRTPGPIYHALNSACTHEGCIVPPLDSMSQMIQCRCHGSRYTLTGEVVNGPAGFPLQKYDTSLQNGVLLVRIPDLVFDVTIRKSLASGRIELEFIAFTKINYQVVFHPALQSDPEPVPFATTSTGPETHTSFAGIDDYAKLYVTPKVAYGFFEVIMKTAMV